MREAQVMDPRTQTPRHLSHACHCFRLTKAASTFLVSPRLRARAQTTVPGHVTTNQGRTWDKGEGGVLWTILLGIQNVMVGMKIFKILIHLF